MVLQQKNSMVYIMIYLLVDSICSPSQSYFIAVCEGICMSWAWLDLLGPLFEEVPTPTVL